MDSCCRAAERLAGAHRCSPHKMTQCLQARRLVTQFTRRSQGGRQQRSLGAPLTYRPGLLRKNMQTPMVVDPAKTVEMSSAASSRLPIEEGPRVLPEAGLLSGGAFYRTASPVPRRRRAVGALVGHFSSRPDFGIICDAACVCDELSFLEIYCSHVDPVRS